MSLLYADSHARPRKSGTRAVDLAAQSAAFRCKQVGNLEAGVQDRRFVLNRYAVNLLAHARLRLRVRLAWPLMCQQAGNGQTAPSHRAGSGGRPDTTAGSALLPGEG